MIALIGRPNSGKSTLLNTIIGEEVSIVSALPQTTRSTLRGIYSTDSMQLVFVDTPGVHLGRHAINKYMLEQARTAAADEVDLLCYLIDLSRREYGPEETVTANLVKTSGVPVVLVFNKIDLVEKIEEAVMGFYRAFPELSSLHSVRLSACDKNAKARFLEAVDPFIRPGPRYFDPDDLTDSTLRQIAAEYIRKEIIEVSGEEVPHAVFVEIESYRETAERHFIVATVHVETRGQRGIIVGKQGKVIDRIRQGARKRLSKLTGVPVSITCHVKVSPHWRDDVDFLRHMGAC